MAIYAKINKVMKDVRGVGKDSFNQHAKYKYAGHEAVTDALRDSFARHGIVRQASVLSCDLLEGGTIKVMVRVTYTDVEDGTKIEIDMPAIQPSQTKSREVTAQQVGQAVSYAVKNVEFKLFALTGDTEADSDSLPVEREEYESYESAAHDDVKRRALDLLKQIDQAKDKDTVLAVTALLRNEWSTLKVVPGLAEDIVRHRERALKRLSNGAGASRQPGQEG